MGFPTAAAGCSLFILALGYNRFLEMKVLMKLFESELDRFLNLENFLDCKTPPEKLLRELKANDGRKLLKVLETPTSNGFKIIRMLSVANLLLIYSKNWFDVVETQLRNRISKDEWINERFLEPYYHFILKCCTSRDAYNDSKTLAFKKTDTLQMLFYSINMLRLLFKVVEKMPLIGRYYKPKNNAVVSSAIETIALQAQRLYNTFKHCIAEILNNPQVHLTNKKDEAIMRGILVDELSSINEQMKKLFLDKYFYPLGRGIMVKLFRPDEQSPELEHTYNSIVSNHEETERQRRRDELEGTLFPGSGLVNWNFYEETLLAGPQLNVTVQAPSFMDLDDIAISEEDEKVEEVPLPSGQGRKEESQKETNTGTLQIKGHEM